APLFVGVDDGPGGAPGATVTELEFATPQPNPTRNGVARPRMWFGVPAGLAGQRYELAIYDLTGRLVKRVDTGAAPSGRFSLEWNLRDAVGRPVNGGVYFARFSLGAQTITRKLVVLQ
ncbi:MAG: FlgD Ig-like domain, partial [Candidatus Eisenbacteria bacterium]